jgi:hypothetical protein
MVAAVKAQKVKSPKAKKAGPKPKKSTKGGKKKKQTLKFVIECKNPVEDGIMKTQAFVSGFILIKILNKN